MLFFGIRHRPPNPVIAGSNFRLRNGGLCEARRFDPPLSNIVLCRLFSFCAFSFLILSFLSPHSFCGAALSARPHRGTECMMATVAFTPTPTPQCNTLHVVACWSSRCMTHKMEKADSTLRSSQAVPHPSTDRALRCLTSEVERDPVHSTRYGRRQIQ